MYVIISWGSNLLFMWCVISVHSCLITENPIVWLSPPSNNRRVQTKTKVNFTTRWDNNISNIGLKRNSHNQIGLSYKSNDRGFVRWLTSSKPSHLTYSTSPHLKSLTKLDRQQQKLHKHLIHLREKQTLISHLYRQRILQIYVSTTWVQASAQLSHHPPTKQGEDNSKVLLVQYLNQRWRYSDHFQHAANWLVPL